MDDEENPSTKGGNGFKKAIILFLVFLVVISSAFIENMNIFSASTVDGGQVTAFGYIVQGVFLVIIYSVLSYLVDAHII